MDITDPNFRKAIEPLIAYDNIIYTTARYKFIESLHTFLAKVEKSQYPRYTSVNVNNLRKIFIKQ